MTDHFKDRAADYDAQPVPQQISEGVTAALTARVAMTPDMTVLDFGAGTVSRVCFITASIVRCWGRSSRLPGSSTSFLRRPVR
jgi:hypothetical protein